MADVFRPRLPLDPFAALDSPQPWSVQPLPAREHPARHTILVLGAPSHADLAPLASSPHLSASLLILATHTPPPLDRPSHSHPGPSILILHLPAPLAVHDSGAVRLVSLLERAQRAAATWAASPSPRIQQLCEDGPGGEFVVREEVEVSQHQHQRQQSRGPPVANPSPLNPYASGSSSTSPASSSASLASTVPHSKPKPLRSKPKSRPTATVPFTAILSFLPGGLPDKALLKHAILVTTLSAPFLSTSTAPLPLPLPPALPAASTASLPRSSRRSILAALPFSSLSLPASAHPETRRRSRLASLFSASSHRLIPPPSPSVDSLPPVALAPDCKPHLVHVLPYSASPPPLPLPQRRPQSYHLAVPGGAGPSGYSKAPPIQIQTQIQTQRKTKLVQSIEQFLLSFAYPLVLPSLTSMQPSGSGVGLRGSRTAPSSPSRTSPTRGFPPPLPLPLPPPSSFNASSRSKSTSALARPASAPSSHQARSPSSSSSSRSPSSAARSQSRPTSTYSTYSAISGFSAYSDAQGEKGKGKGQGLVPYLVPAGVLGCAVAGSSTEGREGSVSVSVGEAVVLGLLDGAAAGEGWPRAWIGGAGEVVVEPEAEAGREEGDVHEHDMGSLSRDIHDHDPGTREAEVQNGVGGKGKGKAKAKRRRVRRNEAGLPTPPESSSSLDSGSGSEEGDEDGHRGEREREYVHVRAGLLGLDGDRERDRGVVAFPVGSAPASEAGQELEGEREGGGGKKTLRTRVSSFFGRKGKGKGVRRREVEQGSGGEGAKGKGKGKGVEKGQGKLTRKIGWGRG